MVVLLASACGAGDDEAQSTGPQTSVEVTLWPEGREGSRPERVVLQCEPAGGSHPLAEEACAALAQEEGALEPVPGDVACTQIYGGPQEARIAGVVGGRAVDAMFSRNNGCEIDRWDRLAPVFQILALS